MARYFAVNSLAGGTRNSSPVKEDTTAGRFDSNYVSSSVLVTNGSATTPDWFQIAGPFLDGSTSLSTIWLRFDLYATNVGASVECLKFMSGATNAYRILNTTTNTVKMQAWNTGTSAWVDWGTTFTVSQGVLNTIVIKLVCATSFEVYVAGSLVHSNSTPPTNPVATIDRVRLSNWNSSGSAHYSQIMAADYDLRDAHTKPLLANANGFYTDGTGTYQDIDETVLDDADAIGLPAVGNKKSFTKAAITVPTGLTIMGMVVNARVRVGGGVVTNGKILVRSSGTNVLSANKNPGSSYEPRSHLQETDPATGVAFTLSGYNNAEFGLEAA